MNNNIDEALELYGSVCKNFEVTKLKPGPDSTTFWAEFTMEGQELKALNGGPQFQFTEAISLFVACDSQEEVDHYWDKLISDGGQPSRCGWLKDKFGLSWQIIPVEFMAMQQDPERGQKAMQAMLTMQKLDLAKLREAFNS